MESGDSHENDKRAESPDNGYLSVSIFDDGRRDDAHFKVSLLWQFIMTIKEFL